MFVGVAGARRSWRAGTSSGRRPAYQRESAAYARLDGTVTESVEGARTIDALRIGRRRTTRGDDDLHEAFEAERGTLNLRTVLFPGVDFAFMLAPIAVLVWGGFLASEGTVTIGMVATIVMYTYQLQGPVWELIFWLDEIQVAATSLSRIIGVRLVPMDRTAGDAVLPTRRCAALTSATPTARAPTCCTASTSTSGWGSGWRSSGPRARASRRSAACWPASTRPRAAR